MTDQHPGFEAGDDSKTSPKADPKELRKRIAHAIHRYDNHHVLSGNDIPSEHHYGEADFVLTELRDELDALTALRAVACGYCPACGRGDAAPTVEDWEQQKQRADEAERQRAGINRMYLTVMGDLGIALNRLDQIRDAARLHQQQLISTREMYAAIDADDQPAPAETPAADKPA